MGEIDNVGKGPIIPQRAATTGPVKPIEAKLAMSTDGLKLSTNKGPVAEGPDPKLQKLSLKVIVDGATFAGGLATAVLGVGAAVAGLAVIGIPLAVVGIGVGVFAFFKMRKDQAAYDDARKVARAEGRL